MTTSSPPRVAESSPTSDDRLTAALAFARERRFGHLATATSDGSPSVVPVCFAVVEAEGGPALVIALDQKPKRRPVRELRRVRDLLANPRAAMVVDTQDEDWTRLAFAQFRGQAELLEPGTAGHATAIAALRSKYTQYQVMPIEHNPVIRIAQLTATMWRDGAEDQPGARPVELAALVRGRRSVRVLGPDPVPRALIERAIAAAGWAPSPHGRQPWRFVVIESLEAKRTLADAMAAEWTRQFTLDGQDATIVQIRLGKSRARILAAPVLVMPCLFLAELDEYPDAARQAAEETMAIQSLGAAVQNLLLTVYEAGFDAGWMCAPLFCPGVVREALGLDRALIPHALIPIGKAAAEPVRRPRRPLAELIVDWR